MPPKKRSTESNTDAVRNKKKLKGANCDPKFLFTSTKSCLTTLPLAQFINDSTWEMLTLKERQECLALLPDSDKHKLEDGTWLIRPDFFRYNASLQESMHDFQESLADGLMLPSRVKQRIKASVDRMAGMGDEFKEEQYELYWGQKSGL